MQVLFHLGMKQRLLRSRKYGPTIYAFPFGATLRQNRIGADTKRLSGSMVFAMGTFEALRNWALSGRQKTLRIMVGPDDGKFLQTTGRLSKFSVGEVTGRRVWADFAIQCDRKIRQVRLRGELPMSFAVKKGMSEHSVQAAVQVGQHVQVTIDAVRVASRQTSGTIKNAIDKLSQQVADAIQKDSATKHRK